MSAMKTVDFLRPAPLGVIVVSDRRSPCAASAIFPVSSLPRILPEGPESRASVLPGRRPEGAAPFVLKTRVSSHDMKSAMLSGVTSWNGM